MFFIVLFFVSRSPMTYVCIFAESWLQVMVSVLFSQAALKTIVAQEENRRK